MFDVVAVGNDEIAIMMADVSGHGLPAALLTSVAKVLFRTGAERYAEPGFLLRWLNRQMSSYLAPASFSRSFSVCGTRILRNFPMLAPATHRLCCSPR